MFRSETGRLTGANLTDAVNKVLKMWEEKTIYDSKFINGLRATFARLKEFSIEFVRQMATSAKDPETTYIFPKLAEAEEYLKAQYQEQGETLEKKCRQNGVSTKGSFDEILTRMLNLEYQVLKNEYEEIKAREIAKKEKREEEIKATSDDHEFQLVALRNKIMDIQRLYLEIDAESIDGSALTVEDLNLLDLPKDLLLEKKVVINVAAEIEHQEEEDTIDGAELLPEEMKYLEGHESEVFITVDIQDKPS